MTKPVTPDQHAARVAAARQMREDGASYVTTGKNLGVDADTVRYWLTPRIFVSDMWWTDENTETLIRHWNTGISAATIAERMGVTKGAVAGKISRLADAGRVTARSNPAKKTTPVTHGRPPAAAVAAGVRTIPLLASEGGEAPGLLFPASSTREHAQTSGCHWPIGDPGQRGFRFCGEARAAKRQYCADHCAVSFVRTRGVREDAAD